MAKFSECPEAERIIFLKDQFISNIEEIIVDPTNIKKLIKDDDFKTVMDFIPALKAKDCACNKCIDVSKLEGRIPPELNSLIEVSRKQCEERSY